MTFACQLPDCPKLRFLICEVEISQDNLRERGEHMALREAFFLGLPSGVPPGTSVATAQTKLGTESWGVESFLCLLVPSSLILINSFLWPHRQTRGAG